MDKQKIITEFKRIKAKGYLKSNRKHNTGIGKTFEDYLGVDENNIKEPDFAGFEVKSQRVETSSYLTLFTKSPSYPRGANTILRDSYGEIYPQNPNLKKLHTSIFSNRYNSYKGQYGFKIKNDRTNKRLLLSVKDLSTKSIVNEDVFRTYPAIDKCITTKFKALFYVNADTKIEGGAEHFHYTSATIYLNPALSKFLDLVDAGKLMVDIRIGSYKSGRNFGKTHDHGTGFRIRPIDLTSLYDEVFNVT